MIIFQWIGIAIAVTAIVFMFIGAIIPEEAWETSSDIKMADAESDEEMK